MPKPLLLDIEPLSCGCTDHVLETLYKSLSDPPDNDKLWRPHHDPYVRDLIEDVTERGQKILLSIQAELIQRIGGEPIQKLQSGKGVLAKAGEWMRWNKKQLDHVKKQIEAKDPADYTINDWMLLVDWIVQKYLPADVISRESEYLAVRSLLAGKVQANLDSKKPDHQLVTDVIAMVPSGRNLIPFTLNDLEASVYDFAQARAAEFVTDIGDNVRHRIKQIILQHEALSAASDPEATLWNLQSKMLDEFGALNRDWRRIALTETVRNANEGFIAGVPIGTRVRRVEAYEGACNFCRKINGMEFTVVSASKEDKNGETEVWVGKTNMDRSASPRRRVGEELVERTASELWWPAAGVQHPNCFISPKVPVYTSNGWKPIKDIDVNDLVLTHKGRFKKVTQKLNEAKHTGNVFSLTVASNGSNKKKIPSMTPEHPVLTDSGWKRVRDVLIGDVIVSLAKTCPGCDEAFVNLKHPNTVHCSAGCSPHLGKNQFSTNDIVKYREAVDVTRKANIKRMKSLTVEQRAQLTSAGRKVSREKGYSHLTNKAVRSKGNTIQARNNYSPNQVEIEIAGNLSENGLSPKLQGRIPKTKLNIKGRRGYWFPDIVLEEEKIAIEIDGEYWHRNRDDVSRDEDIEGQGWTVLRFDIAKAKNDISGVVDNICRVAMNHSGDYVFGSVTVVEIAVKSVVNAKLWNFSVEEDESYIISGGVVVHNCRGGWTIVADKPPEVSQEFADWLENLIEEDKKKHA